MKKDNPKTSEPVKDPIQDGSGESKEKPLEDSSRSSVRKDEKNIKVEKDSGNDPRNDPSEENLDKSKPVNEEFEKDKEENIGEWKDKYLRLFAELENIKKRHTKERSDFLQIAHEGLILALLPVLDDFERARESWEGGKEAFPEGLALVEQKMFKILKQRGLSRIEISVGDAFDMDLHEAISQVPSEEKKGKIISVAVPGYRLNDKVIRFAKVIIGT
ncbi:MAG: nucleotide exchange factor GrpE [Cytophagales bacterium]|nr:nucleotide exchange factor GrpE [Cytophagales bacterium]